jgi:hypothetical protein
MQNGRPRYHVGIMKDGGGHEGNTETFVDAHLIASLWNKTWPIGM